MPTYEYHCDGCGRDFEVKQRITAESLKTCDVCGGAVRRLLSSAPFILKGEGWYVTDYPSASRKKAMESDKGGDKSAASTDKASTDKASTEKSTAASDSTSTSSSAPSAPSASSSSTKSD